MRLHGSLLCVALLSVGCTSPAPFLRTPPAPLPLAGQPISRFAVGSCNDQEESQKHWKAIEETSPELFLFIGDNVYGDVDSGDPALPELREAYLKLAADPDFDRFQGAVPILPTWDDHDYGKNDAGGEFALRKESEALFLKFWGVQTNDPRATRDGVHFAFATGPTGQRIQFILLDTRSFRGPLVVTDERGKKGKERYLPAVDDGSSLLGKAQWTWLEEELRKPADLRVIVSSIQVLPTDHGFESWHLFPNERNRLATLLGQPGIGPVLLLSGDRHIGGLYKVELENGRTLWELTSSSLNKAFGAEVESLGLPMVGHTIADENFGLIAVDWERKELLLSLRGMEGNALLEQAVPFANARQPN